MRKKIIIGVCLFVGVISFAFYFLYPKVTLLKALSNLKKLDSVHLEGSFVLGNDRFELNLTGNANYNTGSFYSQLQTNYLWNTLKVSMYLLPDQKESKLYLKTNFSDNWFVSKKEKKGENYPKKDISLKDISFKKVKSDKKGNYKFELQMPKETFFSIFSSVLDTMDYEEDKIIIYLYIKNQKVTGVSMEKGKKLYLSKESNLYLENVDLEVSSWNQISTISIPKNIEENSEILTEDKLDKVFQKDN